MNFIHNAGGWGSMMALGFVSGAHLPHGAKTGQQISGWPIANNPTAKEFLFCSAFGWEMTAKMLSALNADTGIEKHYVLGDHNLVAAHRFWWVAVEGVDTIIRVIGRSFNEIVLKQKPTSTPVAPSAKSGGCPHCPTHKAKIEELRTQLFDESRAQTRHLRLQPILPNGGLAGKAIRVEATNGLPRYIYHLQRFDHEMSVDKARYESLYEACVQAHGKGGFKIVTSPLEESLKVYELIAGGK